MMWPVPGSMALSEHLLGLSIVATPLQLLGAGPITAYNVCLLLTYALSGFFAYLLGKRLTGSTFAGICAGIAFGFSPYRASQLAHIQVLSSQWMPLALLGLHAYLDTGARRWLVVFGLAWLLQALSNGYFLLFFPVLIGAWLLWFVDWRRAPRRGPRDRRSVGHRVSAPPAGAPQVPPGARTDGTVAFGDGYPRFQRQHRVLFPCRADVALLA